VHHNISAMFHLREKDPSELIYIESISRSLKKLISQPNTSVALSSGSEAVVDHPMAGAGGPSR